MKNNSIFILTKSGFLSLSIAACLAQAQNENALEEVYVTGIRASLEQAMNIKRESSGVVDAISAEDIGKFPDTNLAESLQRITGVSIDRSGGEGNSITVRGLGPQFNSVTLNGRSMPNPHDGRGFRFDTIAAEMVSGVDVYKTSSATVQSGGIGAAVNVRTARPMDLDDKIMGSVKLLSDVDAGSTTPAASVLFSKRLSDEFGVLAAMSYQKRETEKDYAEVRAWDNREEVVKARGWGSERMSYNGGLVLANFYPKQSAVGRETEERERLNANIALQYAPLDGLTFTVDALYSELEINGKEYESAYWFGHQGNTPASISEHETLNSMEAHDVGLDMFMGAPESRYLLSQVGFNVEWEISDAQSLTFDFSTAEAEQNPDGEFNINRSDIQAVPINLIFDTRDGVTTHYYGENDFEGQKLSLDKAKLHQQDAYSTHNQDTLDQVSLDYTFVNDALTFKAGLMYTDQTKAITGYSTNRNLDGQETGKAYSFRGIFPLVGDFEYDFDGDNVKETYHGLFDSVADAEAAGYGITVIDHAFTGRTPFITFDPNAAYSWIDTLKQKPDFESLDLVKHDDWYEVNEKTTAIYAELTSEVEMAGRPLTIVAGTRVEQTSIDSTSLERTLVGLEITKEDAASDTAENMARTFSTASPYTDGDDYTVFLPSLSFKYDLTDDVVLRSGLSRSITRPELSNMRSSRNFGDIRSDGEAGKATSGNPDLEPYISDNLDFSVEWYLDEASYMSAGLFHKTVDNFIVSKGFSEEIEGVINPATGKNAVYDITRPANQDTKKIHGIELAAQYSFFDTGFGVIANATFVDTDSPFETDQIDSSAVVGLSDSANLIAFYDDNGIQARIAYNWRDAFVQKFGHEYTTTTGEPTQVDSYGQIDLSASYELTDTMSVFFEGINITSEEVYKYSRFENQFLYTETNSARYALGIRAEF